MRRAIPLLATRVLAAASVASTGCRHDGAPPNPAGPQDPTTPEDASVAGLNGVDAADTVVSAEEDGRTIDMVPGGTLTFRLASHSGTGFVWRPASLDGGVLIPVGERTHEGSSVAPGAPRTDVYRFVARSAGTMGIEMDYERPWENQPPVKTVRVVVNVR